MKNLAGVTSCDENIKNELEYASIPAIEASSKHSEVPYSLEGVLDTPYGRFEFRRAWDYWIVSGKVPLNLAEKLYENPEGKKSVRVSGHCGCPPPKERITWFDKEGKELKKKSIKKSLIDMGITEFDPKYRWVENPEVGKPFITDYHIDSQAGLLLFVLYLTKEWKTFENR